MLVGEVKAAFKNHIIESHYMGISDVIDLFEIKTKVESFLIEKYKDDVIDIFFSPGTSAMQMAWYLIHTTLDLNTRLLQVRPKKFSRSNEPELLEIKTERSLTPYSAIVRSESVTKHKEDYIITESIQGVYNRANKIAQTDTVTTLITGESGTGKEHLARHIHSTSARNGKKFIAINCSAFTDELLESRLFGYKKGAFTGALNDHKGFFEEAKGGTIFLDEIGDITSYMQQVLLRVLQEKIIMPIGESKETKVDVRIIAATNRDLVELCRQEKFRWDLYYRLTVAELMLPSLRDRSKEERNQLIDLFLKSKKQLFKRPKILKLTKAAKDSLLAYPFPGNVREMENLIEQLYVFNEGEIEVVDLPQRITQPADDAKLDWKSIEKLHIQKVLKLTNNNKEKAREILDYGSINTLMKKIKEYNIQ